jgi:hypothetical protein
MGGLTYKFSGEKTSFTKVFKDFFTCLDQLFKKDLTFRVNSKTLLLSEYLKAMFGFKHPDTKSISFLNAIPDVLKINFNGFQLNDDQKAFLKTFFSKGLFNEIRTKMALILLQACNKISSFVQAPAFGLLDCCEKIDFLIQSPLASQDEEKACGQEKVFAIQVKSSDRAVEDCPKDGKIYINAHDKSLTQIAEDILNKIKKDPKVKGIKISDFASDVNSWMSTLKTTFSTKPQPA